MSALSYCESFVGDKEDKEKIDLDLDLEIEEEDVLDQIFERCYKDLLKACREGKVNDDDAVIASILSLMERVIPNILEVYKKDPIEYHGKCLGYATALRVTIGACMPFDNFMSLMQSPDMVKIDKCVEYIKQNGKSEAKMSELVEIFQDMKGDSNSNNKKKVDIYG